MSVQYIRDTYGVPVKRGQMVRTAQGEHLAVTRCTHYVHARPFGGGFVRRFHPRDLDYWVDGVWVSGARA